MPIQQSQQAQAKNNNRFAVMVIAIQLPKDLKTEREASQYCSQKLTESDIWIEADKLVKVVECDQIPLH